MITPTISPKTAPTTAALKRAERRGSVMGTRFHVVVVGRSSILNPALDHAVDRLVELESRWSRFISGSEVSTVNRRPGNFYLVSDDTALLLERCQAGREITNGAFDATVLPAVRANGYDTSSARVRGETELGRMPAGARTNTVLVEQGIDPGAIGKGLAADVVVDELLATGVSGAMVNVGGDLVCRGEAPTRDGWVIEIAEPTVSSSRIALVCLESGAVATSTTRKRVWTVEGEDRHHVIDPRSSCVADGPCLATVIASDGWLAEVLATALLVDGSPTVLDGTGAVGLTVNADGRSQTHGHFDRFTR